MVKLVNRAKMSTATTGTGTITLGAVGAGYQSFSAAGVIDGDVVRYVIEDGDNWEIGTGTYTESTTTLTRNVSESSNADAAITLTGSAVVFVSAVAADVVDSLGTVASADLDLSTGNFFQVTAANQTLTFSNSPAVREFKIKLTGSGTIIGYDLPNTSYDSITFSVATQETTPQDVFFREDGIKMYVTGQVSDSVHEYDLSTAWDVSTATLLQSFSVAPEEITPNGLFFHPDGIKMYVTGQTGDDVNEYDLSTAWDVSTASFLQNFSFSAQETVTQGVFFREDGTKMYMTGSSSDSVHEYDLSTAWDVSTATLLQSFSVSGQATAPQGLFFSENGDVLIITNSSDNNVYRYNLSSPWDVSTATFASTFSASAQSGSLQGPFFKPDGTKMYLVDNTTDSIYQYTSGQIISSTVTYPAQVKWTNLLTPTTPEPNQVDTLEFYTVDGGTTFYAYQLGDNHG
jgi:sugar lactone lactonase YvrE